MAVSMGLPRSRPACATVFVFVSTRCPCAGAYGGRLIELSRDYSERDVRFFLVFSNAAEFADEVRAYVARRQIPLETVKDAEGMLQRDPGQSRTPDGGDFLGCGQQDLLSRPDSTTTGTHPA